MAYEPRTYRKEMGAERFRSFVVTEQETDLWIGVDPAFYKPEMLEAVQQTVLASRAVIADYGKQQPDFLTSFSPVAVDSSAHPLVHSMAQAAVPAAVGPMAAVAGAIAEEAGRMLCSRFQVTEVVVENGGDIWAKVEKPLTLAIFAGASPLSHKIGVTLEPALAPLGICTSSGTVGHSFSFGKADAVMIVCRDAARADAYATSFCNRVKTAADIEPVLEEIKEHTEILGAVIVIGDRVGACGAITLRPL